MELLLVDVTSHTLGSFDNVDDVLLLKSVKVVRFEIPIETESTSSALSCSIHILFLLLSEHLQRPAPTLSRKMFH